MLLTIYSDNVKYDAKKVHHGKNNFTVSHGMRIAQMVIKNVVQASLEEIDNLNLTKRGSGGFGSTGTK